MNVQTLHIPKNRLYPIVVLDHILSHRARHKINSILKISGAALFLVAIISYGVTFVTSLNTIYTEQALVVATKTVGLLLVLISIQLINYVLEMFFRFSYFGQQEVNVLTFDVIKIFYTSKNGDVTKSFLQSEAGKKIMLRSGIHSSSFAKFLESRGGQLFEAQLPEITNGPFNLQSLVLFLLSVDEEFKSFALHAGARENDLLGSAEWYMRQTELSKKEEQWWSRERLAGIPGIGKDWSYGESYTLRRYAKEIIEEYDSYASIMSLKDSDEVVSLERILARPQGANAIIVGPSESRADDVVLNFARAITRGTITPELEHKKIFILNYNTITTSLQNKNDYETTLLSIFNEASNAGNIILVISNLPAFLMHAHSIGSDVVTLLEPYLSSARLQVITTSDMDNFHNVIENNQAVISQFEKVVVDELSQTKMIPLLERIAEKIETRFPVLFTYGAIEESFTSAENYLTDGEFPDKSINLLLEIAPLCAEKNKIFVERNDILSLITKMTNMPVGEIQDVEREKLLSLEKFLQTRVVGQDEAIKVTANALRRARTGVRNMKRPIGSALFLGPTGVGKTETVKALAESFFGDEEAISRFDMSEYQAEDSLERLIGFSQDNRPGTLTKALKERPYGVLLLDEFEKSNKGILDLFLQILDEGFFSDMNGKRVNARNVIIVATSNAGSDLIWETTNQGVDLTKVKDKIINKIIERGIYKPELLNRFDAVVLFNPLGEKELAQIARIMLEKLKRRLKEKSLDLVITDDLLKAVIRHGSDPMFGARPMNRAIQEKVEQAVADKLIRGEIREGSQVIINSEEIA